MPAAEDHPIEGQVILLAGARASVTLDRLSELVSLVHAHVTDRRDTYDRRFERVEGTGGTTYYLVPDGHWETVGDDLELTDREADAVRRAHQAQFERDGRRLDRREEFETSLEIREVVAV